MKQTDFDEIKRGAILQHKATGESYVVESTNGSYGTVRYHIGVRTVSITNPSEWTLEEKMSENYDGWAVKDGKRIVASSLSLMSEKEAEKWLEQYASHAGRLMNSYKIIKVRLVEVV